MSFLLISLSFDVECKQVDGGTVSDQLFSVCGYSSMIWQTRGLSTRAKAPFMKAGPLGLPV